MAWVNSMILTDNRKSQEQYHEFKRKLFIPYNLSLSQCSLCNLSKATHFLAIVNADGGVFFLSLFDLPLSFRVVRVERGFLGIVGGFRKSIVEVLYGHVFEGNHILDPL